MRRVWQTLPRSCLRGIAALVARYTYSNECALLAYNFHELVSKLGIFEIFAYRPLQLLTSEPWLLSPCRHDHRLISVTLAYILYRYQAAMAHVLMTTSLCGLNAVRHRCFQSLRLKMVEAKHPSYCRCTVSSRQTLQQVHHCDMALDLALTLVYLEAKDMSEGVVRCVFLVAVASRSSAARWRQSRSCVSRVPRAVSFAMSGALLLHGGTEALPRCFQSDLRLGRSKRDPPGGCSSFFLSGLGLFEVTWRFSHTPSTRTDRYDSPTGRTLGDKEHRIFQAHRSITTANLEGKERRGARRRREGARGPPTL